MKKRPSDKIIPMLFKVGDVIVPNHQFNGIGIFKVLGIDYKKQLYRVEPLSKGIPDYLKALSFEYVNECFEKVSSTEQILYYE